MTRRSLLSLAALPLRAQIGYREYARCLPDYLSALALEAYQRREKRIAAIKGAAGVREYQAWARRTFAQLIGALPAERTPLNVRTVGAFERERYRVEKLVYESRPGMMIPANLYLPKSATAPYPGVLFQMGHSINGKGYALYQRCCQGLVQLGYVVLAFDPIGQGERAYYLKPDGAWLTRLGATQEHTAAGRQMLLVGETATGALLWDAMRSLDVLASHPQVDAKRLASTGQSGGGTLTQILAAMDDRLAAAAVSSGNTENYAVTPFLAPGSSDDAEQDLIGAGPAGFDRWDMLWPFAPKPLLVSVSAHDFFGTYSPNYQRSGREEFAKLKRAYTTLGAADKIELFEEPLPHALSYPMRMAVYNWFERHLKQSSRPIEEEPPTEPEQDETLWCGKTGVAIRDFGGKSPAMLTAEKAHTIHTPDDPADLRKLLGMDTPTAARLEVRARTKYRNCDVVAVEVNTADHVWSPAWLFVPKRVWTKLLVIVEPNGRNGAWHEDEMYDKLATSGTAVCVPDVRGVGDLEPQFAPGAVGYARGHAAEEQYAWASLILGRSLLGQRTTDIAAYLRALAAEYPTAEIVLAAREKMTVPALCAAALESKVRKVYLARGVESWRSVTETPNYTMPMVNIVPGALAVTDLPEIAQAVGRVETGREWDFERLSKL